jgi:hypothetical protein
MVNNLGVDSHEWFDNPLDRMPIATNNKYHPDGEPPDWEDTAPSEYEPSNDWFTDKVEKPDESDEIEEEKTMHQKMYEMAIEKHNPWNGGSENFQGGSEKINGT